MASLGGNRRAGPDGVTIVEMVHSTRWRDMRKGQDRTKNPRNERRLVGKPPSVSWAFSRRSRAKGRLCHRGRDPLTSLKHTDYSVSGSTDADKNLSTALQAGILRGIVANPCISRHPFSPSHSYPADRRQPRCPRTDSSQPRPSPNGRPYRTWPHAMRSSD